MENVDIWNRLVKHFNDNRSVKEEKIQKDWEDIFSEFFGYSRLYGEIDSHRSIQIGSQQRVVPDIIIKGNGGDLFDVELKQYNLGFSPFMENQLKSYLSLLHISIGILICDSIYLCNYDFKQDVLKKVKIDFKPDNPDGIMLVDLIKKDAFSLDKVVQFIEEKTSFEENVKQIRAELTPQLINELLVKYFSDRFTKEEILLAIKTNKCTHTVEVITKNMTMSQLLIRSERGSYRGKIGFQAYNYKGQNIGLIFMTDDPRTPAYENIELCVYAQYKSQYGEWKRIKSRGGRIKWSYFCQLMERNEEYIIEVDNL